MRLPNAVAVYPVARLAELVLIQERVGGVGLVVVATADGLGGRAYESGGVRFTDADPAAGTLTDAAGGVWLLDEDGLRGPGGRRLPRLGGHQAFWFAIANHTPQAALFAG